MSCIDKLPDGLGQQLLSLFVVVAYMQLGGTAFRRTVPWTAVDLSDLTSLRSVFAYVRAYAVSSRAG